MNILGIGGSELVIVFLIMLIIAGPKRMIHWSYIMGKYVAKLRQMWTEAANMIQKELDEAGVDVQVPRELPTRQNLNREARKIFSPVTQPLQQALDEAKAATTIPSENGRPADNQPAASVPQERPDADLGAWSSGGGKDEPESGFGAWSASRDRSKD
jgi:Sec-independent protein translocase protein TatA